MDADEEEEAVQRNAWHDIIRGKLMHNGFFESLTARLE